MTRLFVALWPSPSALAAASTHVDAVRPQHRELRWQPVERWHLTLAFLGPADVDRTGTRLDRLLADPPTPEDVRITGAGTFGPVVWLGVAHGEWLSQFARGIQRELRTADQRFRAHVTVARGRGSDARQTAAAAVPGLADHDGPAWLPHEVTLVESVTGPSPQYTVVQRWALAAEGGPGDSD